MRWLVMEIRWGGCGGRGWRWLLQRPVVSDGRCSVSFSGSRDNMDVLGCGDLGMPRNASLPFIRSDPLSLPYLCLVIASLSIPV